MVKVVGYRVCKNKEGKEFISRELQGDLVMVQSQETGRFYATAKKTSITSTFSEDVVKTLIGKEIPGRIERVACEPYEYTVEETGEVLNLTHRYDFFPESAPAAVQMRVVPGGQLVA